MYGWTSLRSERSWRKRVINLGGYLWMASMDSACREIAISLSVLWGWALGIAVFQIGIQRCRVGVVPSLNSVVASAFVVAAGMVIFEEHLPADPLLRVFVS